jgi:hypothetical protein
MLAFPLFLFFCSKRALDILCNIATPFTGSSTVLPLFIAIEVVM